MINASAEIVIGAPLARVWHTVTDVATYADWNPLITAAHGEATVGGIISMMICPPGLMRRRANVEVLALQHGREFRWLGRWGVAGILDGDHAFRLQPLEEHRTRVLQIEIFSGILARPLAPILVPRMIRGFEAMNEALKVRCETCAGEMGG